MKKYSYIMIALTLLICGVMPTKALAQSGSALAGAEHTSYILDVVPIDQHLSPSIYNDYDCFIASMFMALNFLGEDMTYGELIPIVRGNDKDGLSADSDFVLDVTQGRLLATGRYTANLADIIVEELTKGFPVVVTISNMSLLAENWNSTYGHAVLVYGVHNGWFFYIDPFNGGQYTMPIQSFIDASLYPSGSFAITFEKQANMP